VDSPWEQSAVRRQVRRSTEFPLEPGALEYVKDLAKRYAQAANSVREAIDQTADLGDADTADLFTQISRDLDKSVWFLEAHFRA
jgi:starvation-inducible DNA-binding protein